ncbi:ABC transporter ATP-binding protein [Amphibiibacter pelophylacis]|uniref:ABC transporter ATP-binding protein n=1 Tax=Amphibiibacter pelophylacis TaxID=1799477 RepID=A0ACC6P5B5_9BURK
MSAADLSVQDLTVRYGSTVALRGLSLDVAQGSTLMLTGPNGAGKSTLCKSLIGWVRPASGALLWQGQSLAGLSPEDIAARGIAMIPEGRHVFGSLSVIDNLRVAATRRRDRAGIAADLDRLLAVFPMLQPRLQQAAGMLSGGQQQMLVIARALMGRPRLLVIDEPSLGLAPQVTDQVYATLRQLQAEQGLSLLIVEQSSRRAAAMSSPLVLLREGQAVLRGPASQIDADTLERAYFGDDSPALESPP